LYHILASPANQTLQWLLVDEGRTEEALALNRETQRQAAKAGLTAVAEYMDLLAAWMHWYAGDAQPACQWTARHPLQGSLADQLPYLASILLHVRVLAESGRGDEALAILDELEGLTLAVERRLDWMRVMRDKALAWQTLGKTSQALEALAAALEAAVPIQHRQLFYQERASLAPLLEKLRPRFPHFIHAISVSAESPRRTDNILIDPPTARELEILRLVAAGLSNADIAERLYITVGTTKWHMHHVFAKLGVSRRTEAIAKARELGLI
jgi:LuxR family maltose regulon positive regulatory protein